MEIRNATTLDIPQINTLYQLLFAEMATLEPRYLKNASHIPAFLEDTIQSTASTIFVATEEEQVIGFVLVNLAHTPPFPPFIPHTYTHLVDIAVNREWRNKGVGSSLFSFVKDWAKERHCDYIELNVLSQNVRAQEFYQDKGFAPYMECMRYTL